MSRKLTVEGHRVFRARFKRPCRCRYPYTRIFFLLLTVEGRSQLGVYYTSVGTPNEALLFIS